MKVFNINNLVFKLPDEFNGNMGDVFQEITNYIRSKEDGLFENELVKDNNNCGYEGLIEYLDEIFQGDKRVDIDYGLIDIDKDNRGYKVMGRKFEGEWRME